MATAFITALLARFAEDRVVSLDRRDPPTHAVARAVYRDGEEVVVGYELIDAPPPPGAVGFEGELSEQDVSLPLFPVLASLSLDENVRRWRAHVRGAIRLLGRRPAPPAAAEPPPPLERFLTGVSTAVAFEPRTVARPPEPPPPPPLEAPDDPPSGRWRRQAMEVPSVSDSDAPDTSPDTSPSVPPVDAVPDRLPGPPTIPGEGGLGAKMASSSPPPPRRTPSRPAPSRPAPAPPSRPAPPPPSRPATRRSAPPSPPRATGVSPTGASGAAPRPAPPMAAPANAAPKQVGSSPTAVSGAPEGRPGSVPPPPAPPPPPPVFEPAPARAPVDAPAREFGSVAPPAPPPPAPFYGDDEA